ncbi:hypothetical protein TIFTF001_004172 [Ficus carica]|uniref:Uncharacterized protein n=1 Tax=Ficus carica TaxID=3494 RepID=A0AA87ZIE7_FICCA|nr:hypothetical protein TIFTF001_004172 [Ficus carica]
MSTTTTTTTTETPSEILIPSLPNDVALQCLARVPRQYHPVLAAVSKPVRSLLSSPEFFAARSALNCAEHLLYFRIGILDFRPARWFTLYRRPNPNSAAGNFTMAPVPGNPNDCLQLYKHAVVGPKIYLLSDEIGHKNTAKVWIFDCRFHTWERGPNIPTCQKFGLRTVVLDAKIYVFGSLTVKGSWADVFDTVAGRWEALPSPELTVYDKLVLGCGVKGGKVCVWVVEGVELRFDPGTKTWEVNSLALPGFEQICEVNGVLCCCNGDIRTLKGFDERVGLWKEINLVNGGFPNDFLVLQTLNVGGRLVIVGLGRMGVWCAEFEVKQDRDNGDFSGEVLWSDMVYLMHKSFLYRLSLFNTCMPVSL